jgi:hypothetical protein
MLAPPNKMPARPTRKELQEEADRWLALYEEPEEESIDGVVDVSCRYRLDSGNPVHPNYYTARHTYLAGAHIWNGARGEKNARRPHSGWSWVTTEKSCRPDRSPDDPEPAASEPATLKWTKPKLVEIFNPPLIKQHASEPPLPARSLTWTTPRLVEVGAEHLLDFLQHAIKTRTLPTRVFAYLAGRRLAVPGLVKESDTPVEAALRIALWARAHASPLNGWTPACIAIAHAVKVALRLTAGRKRLHLNLGDEATSDWSLLLMVMVGGLSAREAAKHVGLRHSIVAARLGTLIAEITSSLGILSLNG